MRRVRRGKSRAPVARDFYSSAASAHPLASSALESFFVLFAVIWLVARTGDFPEDSPAFRFRTARVAEACAGAECRTGHIRGADRPVSFRVCSTQGIATPREARRRGGRSQNSRRRRSRARTRNASSCRRPAHRLHRTGLSYRTCGSRRAAAVDFGARTPRDSGA